MGMEYGFHFVPPVLLEKWKLIKKFVFMVSLIQNEKEMWWVSLYCLVTMENPPSPFLLKIKNKEGVRFYSIFD